jgi:hypothetical protein
LLALLAASVASADDLSLSFNMTFERPETGMASVSVEISGLTAPGLRLVRPMASGEGWFDAVRASDSLGKNLTVAPTEGGFYITTGGSTRVTVRYTIAARAIGTYGHIGLICGDYAALDGSMIFLLPEEAHTVSAVEMKFSAPRNWRCVTGWKKFGDGWTADPQHAPLRLQVARSLFCFGDFRRISKTAGSNTINCWALDSYPQEDRAKLADAVDKIYGRIQSLLGFETGGEYHAVCLPEAPDGLPVLAGAWSDGLAVTLAGKFPKERGQQLIQQFARFLVSGYFAEVPLGVRLSDEDGWFYPAVFRYAEMIALQALNKMDENTFLALLYTNYLFEASADHSVIDLPFSRTPPSAQAGEFMREVKALILAMRLDYELRNLTGGEENIETLMRAAFQRGGNEVPVRLLDVITDLTGADLTAFYDEFVRRRSLILPTWPSFIEQIKAEAAKGPGPVAATVDGIPIYQAEVGLLAAASPELELLAVASPESDAPINEMERYNTALAILIDEKLLDKALALRKIDVIPEVFWQLRTSLPPKILRVLLTKKRQVLKDVLFNEWQEDERKGAQVEKSEKRQEPSIGM